VKELLVQAKKNTEIESLKGIAKSMKADKE